MIVATVNSTQPSLNPHKQDATTALHKAVEIDDTAAVAAFIASGAELEAQDDNGYTPLYLAALCNKPASAKLLIDAGANKDFIPNSMLGTALMRAVDNKCLEMVKLLVSGGANDIPDWMGTTALGLAISTGQSEITELLITHAGPNKDTPDSFGTTPLHLAVERNQPTTVRLLIARGANKEATNFAGGTALHSAITRNLPEIVKILIAAGANINARDHRGYIPIHQAHYFRLTSIYDLLCQNGAKWDIATGRDTDEARLVGNAWGIEGKKGCNLRTPTLLLFSDILKKREPEIAEAFEADRDFDLTKRLQQIRGGKLVVIQSGSPSHAMTLVFYNGYFAIGNRGRWGPTKVYKINPSKMTEVLLREIATTHLSIDSANVEPFFYTHLPSLLEAETTDQICHAFNDRPLQKQQKGDVCTYTSPEAALFTILALQRLLDPHRAVNVETAIQLAKNQYKEYTTLFRLTIVSRYLDQIANDRIHIDRDLLEQIRCRLKEGSTWHPERFSHAMTPMKTLIVERIERVFQSHYQ